VVGVRIEIASTLTQDDENRLAAGVLKALSGLLDMLPIAYMVRVETTDEHVLQHVSPHLPGFEPVPTITVDAPQPRLDS
jgi:hypothetical protein